MVIHTFVSTLERQIPGRWSTTRKGGGGHTAELSIGSYSENSFRWLHREKSPTFSIEMTDSTRGSTRQVHYCNIYNIYLVAVQCRRLIRQHFICPLLWLQPFTSLIIDTCLERVFPRKRRGAQGSVLGCICRRYFGLDSFFLGPNTCFIAQHILYINIVHLFRHLLNMQYR